MNQQRIALRIIDANLNRFIESLRVIEDALRFSGRAEDINQLKELRQETGNLSGVLCPRLGARDARSDPGLEEERTGNSARYSVDEVMRANLSRAKEALRSVEEYSKLLRDGTGEDLIRWARRCRRMLYDRESGLLRVRCMSWLDSLRLCVLTDESTDSMLYDRVRQAISGGADAIQFRRKNGPDRRLFDDAYELRRITRQSGIPLIINDRPDVAVLVSADGVHLGQDDMPVHSVRSLVGDSMAIGVSTHSEEQARLACKAGADYIGVGPVFSSAGKGVHLEPLGIERAREICSLVDIPCLLIGGINAANLNDIKALTVAVRSAVMSSPDPRSAAMQLKKEMIG